MDDKKKKRWFLILLLLMFVSGLGLLSISRELPFSHDPIEDDSTVYRIKEDEETKGKDDGDKDSEKETVPVQIPDKSKQSIKKTETGPSYNSGSACKENYEDKQEEKQKLNFHVQDDAGNAWESVGDVNIFANEEFEGKAIIAPESSGVYRFFVANEEARTVAYHIEAREETKIKIPMRYRLKCNGVYVTDWKAAEDIAFDMERLETGKRDILELEWKWESSKQDTEIGRNAEKVQYHLYLRLHAEGVSS